MDMDKYFDKLNKALDNTTDEELEELLIKSGIEKCPMEDIERPCTVKESLEQSLKEMKLIREGKLPKRNLGDFLEELKNEEVKE